jgi:hypothetical protein
MQTRHTTQRPLLPCCTSGKHEARQDGCANPLGYCCCQVLRPTWSKVLHQVSSEGTLKPAHQGSCGSHTQLLNNAGSEGWAHALRTRTATAMAATVHSGRGLDFLKRCSSHKLRDCSLSRCCMSASRVVHPLAIYYVTQPGGRPEQLTATSSATSRAPICSTTSPVRRGPNCTAPTGPSHSSRRPQLPSANGTPCNRRRRCHRPLRPLRS